MRIRKSDTCIEKCSSVLALLLVLAGPAWSADGLGMRATEQLQLQRQQQQDQLQLEMQQSQHNSMNPSANQPIQQLELNQALQQQQLQMNQQRALQARPDLPPGMRGAQAQIEQQRARQESQLQLQQFDMDLQSVEAGRTRNEATPLPGLNRPGGRSLLPDR